jgi:hypothetical protein
LRSTTDVKGSEGLGCDEFVTDFSVNPDSKLSADFDAHRRNGELELRGLAVFEAIVAR